MSICESGRECATVKADCAEWRTKALDVEHHPVVERLRAELARERAMRAATGCRCAVLPVDIAPAGDPLPHLADCPAIASRPSGGPAELREAAGME